MSLDPLNVGRLKTCGENLVLAFPLVFFLSTMNVTSFSVCKLALDALFQQIDTGADLGRGRRGAHFPSPPPPGMTFSFLIQLVFCKKKKCGLLVLK